MQAPKQLIHGAADWGEVVTTLAASLLLPTQLGFSGASVEAFFAYALIASSLIAGGRHWEIGGSALSLVGDSLMIAAILLFVGGLAFSLGRYLG